MKLLRSSYGLREMRRFATITRVLVKHGFGDLVDRRGDRREQQPAESVEQDLPGRPGFPSPQRIRLVLEELGPSFVKLGQLMSTRADIFPPEYIEEFKKLQDQVPPTPFPAIKRVVETELKKPLERIFHDFEAQPAAAASVGQVHVATLFSGEKVAVKIIRPGIDKKIREDIRLMYFLATRIEKIFEVGRILGVVNLVKEFERVIFRELDMLIEAGSIEKFAFNFKDVEEIYIPEGLLGLYDQVGPGHGTHRRDQNGPGGSHSRSRNRSQGNCLIGLRSFSRQLMQFGFFHADPHPGNTLVMADGRVSLVDFGITGYLDDEMMREIANLFLGYAEHDYDLVMDALLDAGSDQ